MEKGFADGRRNTIYDSVCSGQRPHHIAQTVFVTNQS